MKVFTLLLFWCVTIPKNQANQCALIPEKVTKPPDRVNTDRYMIDISGKVTGYVAGQNYTSILT